MYRLNVIGNCLFVRFSYASLYSLMSSNWEFMRAFMGYTRIACTPFGDSSWFRMWLNMVDR